MGLNIRLAEDHDEHKWNLFVKRVPHGHLFHRFEWRSVFAEAYGLTPSFLIAEDHGEVVGVLPLVRAPKLFGKYTLLSLPYFPAAGILTEKPEVEDELVNMARTIASDQSISLQIRQQEALGSEWIAHPQHVTQKVRLTQGADLMASFSQNLRRKVRKAEKHDLQVRFGLEHLPGFYDVYTRNMRDLGTPSHPLSFMNTIIKHFPKETTVLTVYHQETAVGGMFLMRDKGVVQDPWASTRRDFGHLYPGNLMYFAALSYAQQQGAEWMDFGRSQRGSGVYEFKRQWGCEDHPLYYRLFKDRVELPLSEARWMKALSQVWQKLPLAVANLAGTRLRKYVH